MNGTVCSQNCRWWAEDNPNFTIDSKDQYGQKTNVWCGVFNKSVVGPFFFRDNLNSVKYLNFLENELSDYLDELPLNLRRRMWFQLDGAPAHSTHGVRNWLDQKFGEKWIGRFSEYTWPARSPDLTPLDFFLWGFLKQKVYSKRPFATIDDLEREIRDSVAAIPPVMFENVAKDLNRRTNLCIEKLGGHTET